MEIVIDIDDEQVLFDIKNRGLEAESKTDKVIINALYNGTPLPKETTERYKPIILQEHDAEPRTMRAILDVETNDIYILKTTKGFAEGMGMTIEEVNADGDSD